MIIKKVGVALRQRPLFLRGYVYSRSDGDGVCNKVDVPFLKSDTAV